MAITIVVLREAGSELKAEGCGRQRRSYDFGVASVQQM